MVKMLAKQAWEQELRSPTPTGMAGESERGNTGVARFKGRKGWGNGEKESWWGRVTKLKILGGDIYETYHSLNLFNIFTMLGRYEGPPVISP